MTAQYDSDEPKLPDDNYPWWAELLQRLAYLVVAALTIYFVYRLLLGQ